MLHILWSKTIKPTDIWPTQCLINTVVTVSLVRVDESLLIGVGQMSISQTFFGRKSLKSRDTAFKLIGCFYRCLMKWNSIQRCLQSGTQTLVC